MKKTIFLLMLFFVMSVTISFGVLTAEDRVGYHFLLHYDNGNLTAEEATLGEGYSDHRSQPDEGYTLKVISFWNETLYQFKFIIDPEPACALKPEWFDENGTQIYFPPPCTSENKTTIGLNAPWFVNASRLEIYDPNDVLVLTIDVSWFNLCNYNGVCDRRNQESFATCPRDCSCNNGICEEWETKETCPKDCGKVEPISTTLIATAILILFIGSIAYLVYVGVRKLKERKPKRKLRLK